MVYHDIPRFTLIYLSTYRYFSIAFHSNLSFPMFAPKWWRGDLFTAPENWASTMLIAPREGWPACRGVSAASETSWYPKLETGGTIISTIPQVTRNRCYKPFPSVWFTMAGLFFLFITLPLEDSVPRKVIPKTNGALTWRSRKILRTLVTLLLSICAFANAIWCWPTLLRLAVPW